MNGDLMKLEISRPRRHLKKNYRFTDKNADRFGTTEFRTFKDPNFKLIREMETGIQVSPMTKESNCQTLWYRNVNTCTQYEPIHIDYLNLHNSQNIFKDDGLLEFLETSVVEIERALQANEIVDIYHDAFRTVDSEALNNQVENELKELKNFADPTYSKFKSISSIDWLPKANGIVAVSTVRNLSIDSRLIVSGYDCSSYILIWDFRQLVKPILILEAQYDVVVFKFNAINPDIVVGGCINGQILYWDISEHIKIALGKNKNRRRNAKKSLNDNEENESRVIPKHISLLENSHSKSVSDLFWLPPDTQINSRGQLVPPEFLDRNSYQFITISTDGILSVWDIRFDKIALDELKHIGRSKIIPTEKTSKDGIARALWAPIFKAPLRRLDTSGEISASCAIHLNGEKIENNHSLRNNAVQSLVAVGSEDGDLLIADISSKNDHTKEDEEDDTNDSSKNFIKWFVKDHTKCTLSIAVSPFFPDIILSVSDWNFHIWRVNTATPIFSSPNSSVHLTNGMWSPTRPTVLFLSCFDGHIQVWDFADSSFKASMELKATHSPITSMLFWHHDSKKQQLLAVGDNEGTLHIFDIPRTLLKPLNKEEKLMKSFLDREFQRNDLIQGDEAKNIDSEPSNNSFDEAKESVDNKPESINSNIQIQDDLNDEDFALLESTFLKELK